jgi:hypothetical protein
MVNERKLNNLDKVISLSLDLAHSTKKLFCTIVSNNSTLPNNSSLTIAINSD